VSQFVSRKKVPSVTTYLKETKQHLATVVQHLSSLPDEMKYPETTWEWTIGRDFKDRLTGCVPCSNLLFLLYVNVIFILDTASFLLEKAIAAANEDPAPLVYALYLIETAILFESPTVPSMLLKNAGLGHVHLVQNKLLKTEPRLSEPEKDIFNSLDAIGWPNTTTNTE
jgi:hypothetical protein